MQIRERGFLVDNTIWHNLSIFYSRNDCVIILRAITDFCEEHNNIIGHWSIYFSKTNGECVNFVFALKEQNAEPFLNVVEEYFARFFKDNSSDDSFLNSRRHIYSNNSLGWNANYLPIFLLDGRDVQDFAQATSMLITGLYDADASYDENAMSIASFLRVRLLKRQNRPLPEIADPEVAATIRSYWEYEENDLLATWLHCADVVSAPIIIQCQLDYWIPDFIELDV